MATLNFKGKNIIWNHHLSVPYHSLEDDTKLSYKPEKADGNLLIEGDNLLALKSLLPTHTGKIKCIYIDPPYNTGNENWVYSDNVNSPLIKDWLGKTVAKDDLTRHDKWLCMMTPRLKLLRDLLSDSGLIFVSIDENELHHLRSVMDEIFGEENFITNIVWEKRFTRSNNALMFASIKENILMYRKSNLVSYLRDIRTEKSDSIYSNPDNDPRGDWTSVSYVNPATKSQRPNLAYKIVNPSSKEEIEHPTNAWKFSHEQYLQHVNENKLYWGKNNSNTYPRLKKFLSDNDGIVPVDLWTYKEAGTTDEGTKELQDIFGNKVFENPKPTRLIKKILQIVTRDRDIILDSFSGSGTAAQAVMELNAEDEGDRNFILVQMTEATAKEPKKNICKDITRERIVRVIEKNKKVSEKKKYFENIGFEYKRVGAAIDPHKMLAGELPSYKELAKYVYYLASGKSLKNISSINEKEFYVGDANNTEIYLIYKQDLEQLKSMALTLDFADKVKKKYPKKRKIIYAPACFLDDEYLTEYNIHFVSIPYNLFEIKEEV